MNVALLASSLVSLAAIGAGIYFLSSPDCDGGGICSQSVAIVVGVPLILLGLGALAGAAFTYWADSRHGAPIACLVWACVLLAFAGAIGGAANPIGILLAIGSQGRSARQRRVWFPIPLSIPCVRFSRTRLTGDLLGMAYAAPG